LGGSNAARTDEVEGGFKRFWRRWRARGSPVRGRDAILRGNFGV